MVFSCRLGEIFAEREINQTEFAEKIGVSAKTLSLIKSGTQSPSFPVLYKILEELDLDTRDIWRKK